MKQGYLRVNLALALGGALGAGYLAWVVSLYLLFPEGRDALIYSLWFPTQVLIVVASARYRGSFQQEVRLLGMGCLLIGMGDQAWLLHLLTVGALHAVTPASGPLWLLGHAVIAVGLLSLAWRRHVGRSSLTVLDCFVSTVVLTFFIWKQQEATSPHYQFASLWLAGCFYGSGIVEIGWFLAGMALIVPSARHQRSPMVLGFAALLIALLDSCFAQDLARNVTPSILFVLGSVIGYLGLAWGLWHLPQEGRLWRVEPEEAREQRQLQSFYPYLLTVGFIGLLVAYSWVQRHPLRWELELGLVTVAALLVVRQSVLMVENNRLTSRIRQSKLLLEETVACRTRQLALLHDYVLALGDTLEEAELWQHTIHYGLRLLQPVALSFQRPDPASLAHVSAWESHKTSAKYAHTARIVDGSQHYALLVAEREETPFSETEVGLLESLARSLAAAVSNARAFARAVEQADRDPMTGLLNHRAAMERLQLALEHARGDETTIAILMMDVNNFKLFNDTYGHPMGDTVLRLIARVLRELIGSSGIVARYGGDEFVVGIYHAVPEELASLPARLNARVRQEHQALSAEHRTIPLGVSCGIASFPSDGERLNDLIAVADRRLFEAKDRGEVVTTSYRPPLRMVQDDTEQGILAAMEAMLTAVDNKDRYTRAHSEDVTAYALWLAEGLGATEPDLQTLKLAAMLHDIGKIGVPDDVLRKPGHLSPEEVELMRRHPTLGAMIVAAMPGLDHVIPVVRSHHERWDGKGYPDGTAGEQTPYLARIVAVADAFSAMTTSRPYRHALGWDAALAEIFKGAGTQFDPHMARVFVTVMRKYLKEQETSERERKAA